MPITSGTSQLLEGGIPEVVDSGETGLLVPFGDVAAMTEAVKSLVSDPKRRSSMGEAAKTRARARFSADAIVPRYEALYRRVKAQ